MAEPVRILILGTGTVGASIGLALLVSIPFHLGLPSASASIFVSLLQFFILINLVLFFFNLIPIFPLDGEKVLTYFLPPSGQAIFTQIRPYGPILLAGLVILSSRTGLNLLDWIVRGPALGISNLLIS